MAAIMVVQRWAQVPLAGSQGSSSEMPFVIEPERSSTRSKSAGNWVMLLALLPQFKIDVGVEGEPPSRFTVTLPPVPLERLSETAPPLPARPVGSPTRDPDEHPASPASKSRAGRVAIVDSVFDMVFLFRIAVDDSAAAVRQRTRDIAAGGGLTAATARETDLCGCAARAGHLVTTTVVDGPARALLACTGLGNAGRADVCIAGFVGLAGAAGELVAAAIVDGAAVLAGRGAGLGRAGRAQVGGTNLVGLAGAAGELVAATVVEGAAVLARRGAGLGRAGRTEVGGADLVGLAGAAGELVAATVVDGAAVLAGGGASLGRAGRTEVGGADLVGLAGAASELVAATVVEGAAVLARRGASLGRAGHAPVVGTDLAPCARTTVVRNGRAAVVSNLATLGTYRDALARNWRPSACARAGDEPAAAVGERAAGRGRKVGACDLLARATGEGDGIADLARGTCAARLRASAAVWNIAAAAVARDGLARCALVVFALGPEAARFAAREAIPAGVGDHTASVAAPTRFGLCNTCHGRRAAELALRAGAALEDVPATVASLTAGVAKASAGVRRAECVRYRHCTAIDNRSSSVGRSDSGCSTSRSAGALHLWSCVTHATQSTTARRWVVLRGWRSRSRAAAGADEEQPCGNNQALVSAVHSIASSAVRMWGDR